MSQWSDYLLSKIEKYVAKADHIVLWSIGGAGFVLKTSEATVYIDPYFGPSPDSDFLRLIAVPIDPSQIRKVDAVFSTHEHEDHCDKNVIIPVGQNTSAVFFGPCSSTKLISGWDVSKDRIIEMKQYQSILIKDIKVTALPSNDPQAKSALTYMFEIGKITLFHSGDSLYFDKSHEFGLKWSVDIALLNLGKNPPGETYYMTPCDVVRTASNLGAKFLIPFHWDIWKMTSEAPHLVELIAKEWKLDIDIVILKLGDRFEFSHAC